MVKRRTQANARTAPASDFSASGCRKRQSAQLLRVLLRLTLLLQPRAQPDTAARARRATYRSEPPAVGTRTQAGLWSRYTVGTRAIERS